jgi:hypothetical protein
VIFSEHKVAGNCKKFLLKARRKMLTRKLNDENANKDSFIKSALVSSATIKIGQTTQVADENHC